MLSIFKIIGNIFYNTNLPKCHSQSRSQMVADGNGRRFQEWLPSGQYELIDKQNEAFCVMLLEIVVCRTSYVKRDYQTNHR